jgi:hypothetical protein
MKKQMLGIAAALFLTTLMPAQSHAQYSTNATVPFSFHVGNADMPAGKYEVRHLELGASTAQEIRRTDSSAATFVIANVASPKPEAPAQLIFHCYNRNCFLSEIWTGNGRGWSLAPSRREKEIAQGSTTENELAVVTLPLSVKP